MYDAILVIGVWMNIELKAVCLYILIAHFIYFKFYEKGLNNRYTLGIYQNIKSLCNQDLKFSLEGEITILKS